MPTKKVTTKKPKAKRDFFDLIDDATRKDSTVGLRFFEALNKKGAKAKDLHQLLVDWGYDGISLEDLIRVMKIFKTRDKAQHALLDTGY
jgi:hypothetical protein